MNTAVDQLWLFADAVAEVNADALAHAIEGAAEAPSLDYRTRLLIRDGLIALEAHYGTESFLRWLSHLPHRRRIRRIRQSIPSGEDRGFGFLQRNVVDAIKPDTVIQFLREL